jgi:hypothetical protein
VVVVATTALSGGPDTEPLSASTGPRFLRIAIAAVALAPIGIYLYIALRQLGYPYELEWLEGGSVEIVGRVLHGQALYVAPSLHYVPYEYPPLYFWVSALVAHVTGLSFLPLRLVSLFASLGSFALLFAMVRRETGDAVAGLVAAGLFAATFSDGGAWLDIGRVDSLFLFFLLCSVAVARWAEHWAGGVLIGLFMSASFLTKQSALLAVIPLLAYLVVRRPRVGVVAAGTLGTIVVGSTVVLNATSHGWYWYYLYGELAHQGINSSVWWQFVPGDLLGRLSWMIALGLAGVLLAWRKGGTGTRWAFWLAAAAGLVGESWISRAHVGGYQDTLIPALAAFSLLAGLGYDGLRRSQPAHERLVAAVVLVILVVQVTSIIGDPNHLVPTPADQQAGRQFVTRVADTPGQVIVWDHPWYDTLAGKASWAQGLAIHDVLRSGPSAARTDLLRSIDQVLASPGVSTIYLDNPAQADDFGLAGPLHRYFQESGTVPYCTGCFYPVTDLAFRPSLRYTRR